MACEAETRPQHVLQLALPVSLPAPDLVGPRPGASQVAGTVVYAANEANSLQVVQVHPNLLVCNGSGPTDPGRAQQQQLGMLQGPLNPLSPAGQPFLLSTAEGGLRVVFERGMAGQPWAQHAGTQVCMNEYAAPATVQPQLFLNSLGGYAASSMPMYIPGQSQCTGHTQCVAPAQLAPPMVASHQQQAIKSGQQQIPTYNSTDDLQLTVVGQVLASRTGKLYLLETGAPLPALAGACISTPQGTLRLVADQGTQQAPMQGEATTTSGSVGTAAWSDPADTAIVQLHARGSGTQAGGAALAEMPGARQKAPAGGNRSSEGAGKQVPASPQQCGENICIQACRVPSAGSPEEVAQLSGVTMEGVQRRQQWEGLPQQNSAFSGHARLLLHQQRTETAAAMGWDAGAAEHVAAPARAQPRKQSSKTKLGAGSKRANRDSYSNREDGTFAAYIDSAGPAAAMGGLGTMKGSMGVGGEEQVVVEQRMIHHASHHGPRPVLIISRPGKQHAVGKKRLMQPAPRHHVVAYASGYQQPVAIVPPVTVQNGTWLANQGLPLLHVAPLQHGQQGYDAEQQLGEGGVDPNAALNMMAEAAAAAAAEGELPTTPSCAAQPPRGPQAPAPEGVPACIGPVRGCPAEGQSDMQSAAAASKQPSGHLSQGGWSGDVVLPGGQREGTPGNQSLFRLTGTLPGDVQSLLPSQLVVSGFQHVADVDPESALAGPFLFRISEACGTGTGLVQTMWQQEQCMLCAMSPTLHLVLSPRQAGDHFVLLALLVPATAEDEEQEETKEEEEPAEVSPEGPPTKRPHTSHDMKLGHPQVLHL